MKNKESKRGMGKISAARYFFSVLVLAMVLSGCQSIGQADVQGGDERQAAEQAEQESAVKEEEEPEAPVDAQEPSVKGAEGNPTEDDMEDEKGGSDSTESEASAQPMPDRKEPPQGWELTLASEDWGLSFGESGKPPVGNASAEDLLWYDAYYVGDDSEKVIYLTFDCGYENGNTELILDALKKHHVQATFFVVGHFLETAPDMAKRMVEEGHAVGNHTYHHLDMPTISDQVTFQKEMDDVAELFYEITGTKLSPYYRPPQGKCNVQNLKMAQELGYYTVFWSLAYVDWNQDDQPSHEEAFDKLTTRVHPGAIVLLHNTSQTNGEILDELLSRWEEMGYSFGTLSELVS